MASAQYEPPPPQSNTSSQAGYVNAQQQQKKVKQQQQQPADARMTKRIKTEHGEEQNPSLLPSPSLQQQSLNGQEGLVLPISKSSQQMGPPSSGGRPSISNNQSSYNNGEPASTASPVNQSTGQSASPQPSGSRVNTGPGRNAYQFGMGLPTPGINFTRTPTTGSFVLTNSNNNSRQHTPTDQTRTNSRNSPSDARVASNNNGVSGSGSGSGPGGPRKDGVDQLQDLLSISGVDLKAEEEAAQRTRIARASYNTANAAAAGQSSSVPQIGHSSFYLEVFPLSRQVHRIAAKHGLRVDPEVLTYLSLAAKTRFQNLLEAMIASSRHRTWSSHLRPPPLYEQTGQAMYHEEIHDDPMKLLAALTKVEKRQEQDARQARMQRGEMEASTASIAQGDDDGGGNGESSGQATPTDKSREGEVNGKKKTKKLSMAATAKNMSEDKRLKLANKTAARALGISSSSKAWMFGDGASGTNSPLGAKKGGALGASRLPKPRFTPVSSASNPGESGQMGESSFGEGGIGEETGSITVGGWGDLAARQRLKEEEERLATRRVNLQDALHALEMERSGGAGRGSGELILYSTRLLGRPPIRKM